MLKRLKELLHDERLLRLLRYGIAGVGTTAVNFLLMALLYNGLHWNESVANTVAVVGSVLFAYVVNKLFVFKSKCEGWKALFLEAFSFFSARGVTMLIEIGGVFLFSTLLHFNAWIVKIALNVLVLILNYVFSKIFVFKDK